MKTLFIRNLPFDASETDLRKAFEAYGQVQRCSIAKNRDTGESRGFGFVDIEDAGAEKAIAEMNGRMFGSRSIVVQESEPRGRTGNGSQGSAPSGAGASRSPGAGTSRGPAGPGGMRPSGPGTGGSTGGYRSGSGGASGPGRPRPMGAPGQRVAGPPMSRTAQHMSRTASRPGGMDNKHFGPDAAPAAERLKAYRDRPKDRLEPYKREHFDFREAMDEDEEELNRRRRKEAGELAKAGGVTEPVVGESVDPGAEAGTAPADDEPVDETQAGDPHDDEE